DSLKWIVFLLFLIVLLQLAIVFLLRG
nr:Chain A, De novo designed proton channel LLQL [synthetic construct]7UDV_B Chain B, De novo designed proton channel LLQL [synthetic construct]7UDV_C Chain C, De novo designed proton channel LLQL [synthetic construct]7UDV_D Chain D, De novo designed proton channel LLQL [synthetic construct]7UDV_E Chain E, De novo designed proton channel LLQL [synthetic construct]7UDV_F Chain F, De novo designed proton channel LLQL [synthetic construct]7UDV_G Chain G, De novo designed proton channel LLQL [syn